MTDIDPYAELGVDRDAGDAEIHKAYRDRAKKTHPDVEGGNDEAFGKITRALAILEDPLRRARFDAGEPDDPEKTKNQKIQDVLSKHLGLIIADHNDPEVQGPDPRMIDLVKHIEMSIKSELSHNVSHMEKADRSVKMLDDVRKRFSAGPPDDPIGIMLAGTLRGAMEERVKLEEVIEALRDALKAIRLYRYRMDAPPPTQGFTLGDPAFLEMLRRMP